MKFGMYCVKDRKAAFGQPFHEINDAVAMRRFHNSCLQADSEMKNFGSDFELYRIGTYETDTGVLTPEEKVLLFVGKDVEE